MEAAMYGTIIFIGSMLVAAPQPVEAGAALRDYPPCSRAVTDSCTQLPGASVRRAEPVYQGTGGPYEPIDDAVEEHAAARPVDAPPEAANDADAAAGLPRPD
jgi:hypothetical protein